MDAVTFFEQDWAATSTSIGRSLARRGVPATDRDDVLQETAIRLFRSWDKIDQERGVAAYARRIAFNVWHDMQCKARCVDTVDELPEMAGSGDIVERTSLARLELLRVGRAMSRLGLTDRRALRSLVVEELNGAPHTVPAAQRMARMRARRQLAIALNVASTWLVGVLVAVRVIARGRVVRPVLVGTTVVATAVVMGLGAGGGPSAPRRIHVAAALRATSPHELPAARTASVKALRPVAEPRRSVVAEPAARTTAQEPARFKVGEAVSVAVLASLEAGDVRVEVRDGGRDDVPLCMSSEPTDQTGLQLSCPD